MPLSHEQNVLLALWESCKFQRSHNSPIPDSFLLQRVLQLCRNRLSGDSETFLKVGEGRKNPLHGHWPELCPHSIGFNQEYYLKRAGGKWKKSGMPRLPVALEKPKLAGKAFHVSTISIIRQLLKWQELCLVKSWQPSLLCSQKAVHIKLNPSLNQAVIFFSSRFGLCCTDQN